jgi:signal transduction histidine kinase
MTMPTKQALGDVFALVVHDLRNPTATISANIAFVREVLGSTPEEMSSVDVQEALDDAAIALRDLMRGLEQFSAIARWIAGEDVVPKTPGDAGAEVRGFINRHSGAVFEHDIADEPMPILGAGGAVARILDMLVANSLQHAPSTPIKIRAAPKDGQVVIEVQDQGTAVAPELRKAAFTFEGQSLLKGRSDGRYGRVVGLFAANAIAEAIGAKLEPDGVNGAAIFRLTVPLRTS